MNFLRLNSVKSTLAFCFLFIFFLPAQNVYAEVIDRIVAKVDNEIIALYDLQKLKVMLPSYTDIYSVYASFETLEEKDRFLLDKLINDMLIGKENEKFGITAKDIEIKRAIEDIANQNKMTYDEFINTVITQGLSKDDYKKMIKKQIEKMKFFSRFINSTIIISEKEVLTYFRENSNFFKGKQELTLFHILFLKNGPGAEKARQRADDFYSRIKQGDPFETAAASIAGDSAVVFTGEVAVNRDELAREFTDAMSVLKPGETTGVIETDTAFSVIMLIDVGSIALDKYKDTIRQKIQDEKRQEVYRSILSRMKQEHSIEIRY